MTTLVKPKKSKRKSDSSLTDGNALSSRSHKTDNNSNPFVAPYSVESRKRKRSSTSQAAEIENTLERKTKKRRAAASSSAPSTVVPTNLEFEERQQNAIEARRAVTLQKPPPGAVSYPPADHDAHDSEFDKDDPILKILDFFPKEPMRAMIIGPMKKGKTSMLRWLIEDALNGVYDEVHVWDSNLLTDKGWQWIFESDPKTGEAFPEDRLHINWSTDEVNEIMRNIREHRSQDLADGVPANSQYRSLWIIDDSTSMNGSPMAQGDSTIVNTRHGGISVIIVAHKLKGIIGTLTRGQQDWVVYYPGGNASEDKIFHEEYGSMDGVPLAQLKRIMSRIAATPKPYNYIVWSNNLPDGKKLRHGIGGPHILQDY